MQVPDKMQVLWFDAGGSWVGLSIISRYLIKQTAVNFMAVVVILLAIIVGSVFVRLLGKVADGLFGVEVLWPLLGLSTITSLSVLLAVSLFLAVLVTLGRLYADSEITALGASGMGSLELLKPFIVLGLLVACVQSALVFWLVPNAERDFLQVRAESIKSLDLGGITPGRFVTLSGGNKVVYAEFLDLEQRMLNNIYLFNRSEGNIQVIAAQRASQALDASSEDKYLQLKNGEWWVAEEASLEAQRTRFKTLGLFIPEIQAGVVSERPKTLSTRELMVATSLPHKAELQWRLASPVMVLVLVFLAVPLSHTSPRKGRFAPMAVAVLSCILYFNLLAMAKDWMSAGITPVWMGVWWVHFIPVAAGLALLWKQGALVGLLHARRVNKEAV